MKDGNNSLLEQRRIFLSLLEQRQMHLKEPAKNEGKERPHHGASNHQPDDISGWEKFRGFMVTFAEVFGIPAGAIYFVWQNRTEPITIFITGAAVIFFVHGICRLFSLKKKCLICVATSVLSVIGCAVWYSVVTTPKNVAAPAARQTDSTNQGAITAGWQPPELSNQRLAFVQLGNHPNSAASDTFTISDLKKGPKPFRFRGTQFAMVYVISNRLFVDVDFFHSGGGWRFRKSVPIEVHDRWAVNTTSNEVELVDGQDDVCCQVIYKRPNWVCLIGQFPFSNNSNSAVIAWGPTTTVPDSFITKRGTNLHLKSILEK